MSRKSAFVILTIFGIGLFTLYIYKYQQLVDEGLDLLDERCIALDHIIQEKQDISTRWAEESEYALDETLATYSANLKKLTRDTIDYSGPWLKRFKDYTNRKSFKFFINNSTRQYFYAFYDELNADYLGNIAVLNYLKDSGPEKVKEVISTFNYMIETGQITELKNREAIEYRDFRNRLLQRYIPKCQSPLPDMPIIPSGKVDQTG